MRRFRYPLSLVPVNIALALLIRVDCPNLNAALFDSRQCSERGEIGSFLLSAAAGLIGALLGHIAFILITRFSRPKDGGQR